MGVENPSNWIVKCQHTSTTSCRLIIHATLSAILIFSPSLSSAIIQKLIKLCRMPHRTIRIYQTFARVCRPEAAGSKLVCKRFNTRLQESNNNTNHRP